MQLCLQLIWLFALKFIDSEKLSFQMLQQKLQTQTKGIYFNFQPLCLEIVASQKIVKNF